ncbi:transcription factor bHLH30-like [Dioscorea cayenensis subsp. rotundata]|uniref:Transcription factor bHLH30-like n=1 Tax=Dioscorea cayennensis subsp. rotundata TaxID=55577 RepID=A0AB40CZB9_DIOCR|nr:transcription factor bHLH30-like [Dioscorea cayenensis subsp. rotundata]
MGSFPIGDLRPFSGFCDGLELPASSSLVMDGDRGELMRAGRGRSGGCGDLNDRAAMALKSHSEAERRRRERINAHLSTLRGLIPSSDKLDKASLLAEVISHVKKLKSNATEISKGCIVPSEVDEARVETESIGLNSEALMIKASLSCDDRPEILADLKQTLQTFKLKTLGAEISTLSGRMKVVFLLACEGNISDTEGHLLTTSIQQALRSVLDRATSPQDFLLRASYPNKRRRIPLFESSSSSS